VIVDSQLQALIQQTTSLNSEDKNFLLQNLSQINPLDKMRLRSGLASQNTAQTLQILQLLKANFVQSQQPEEQPNLQNLQSQPQPETKPQTQPQHQQTNQNEPKKEGILSKVANAVFPKKKPEILSRSILTRKEILGSEPPVPTQIQQQPRPKNLLEFNNLGQLSLLDNQHVTFGLNSNFEQVINGFMNNTDQMFDSIQSIDVRRGFFMHYVRSPLFSNYLNTAISGMKNLELQPRKVALNLLHQIDPNYLNSQQFKIAAEITNHLRNTVGL